MRVQSPSAFAFAFVKLRRDESLRRDRQSKTQGLRPAGRGLGCFEFDVRGCKRARWPKRQRAGALQNLADVLVLHDARQRPGVRQPSGAFSSPSQVHRFKARTDLAKSRADLLRRARAAGFTLVELILVMALLVVAVSFVAPRLGGFFRGHTLNSEARQILALMHEGQSRAISGGVPMVLWFDTTQGKYGLEEEPGYVDKDPNAEEFTLNENLKIEVPDDNSSTTQLTSTSSDTQRAGLPQITFLSDGSVAEGSPTTVRLVDNDGPSVSITQARVRNQYEIATTKE